MSRIQGNQYYIRAQIPSNNTSSSAVADALSNYYCEETYRRKGVFTLDNVQGSDLISHYAHKKYSIVSYIGIPIWLHGRIYGTLSFAATHARAEPFDALDQDFIHLLARWVSGTLEHWQHQSEQQILLDRFAKLSANLPGFLYQFQMFTDGSSSFPYASDGIEAIYGLKQNELVQNAAAVLNVLHPDDVGWIGESLSTSAAQLSPWLATYRVVHPTLGEIWVHGEAKPERLKDGSTLWHGFVRDVTIEKNAELKLQEINTLREAIFDAASISIISTDQHGIIKTFNHCAEDLLGYSAAEMINVKTLGILHLPEEIAARAEKLSREFAQPIEPGFEVFIAKAREGDVDENEWTYVRKNGSQVPVLLSVAALRNAEGDISGYLGLGRDISEIKRIDR